MIPARDGDATIARSAMPDTPALLPSASFRFCPRCGQGPSAPPEAPVFSCPACGFHFHFNPAVAAGVIAEDREGRVLLVRRAKEPARGRLGVPGGFVDIGETAEASARREAREETGIDVLDLRFLGSWPNLYEWRGVVYPVVDLYFTGRVGDGDDGLGPARGRGDRLAAPRGASIPRGARLPDHPRGVRPLPRGRLTRQVAPEAGAAEGAAQGQHRRGWRRTAGRRAWARPSTTRGRR